MAIFLSKETDYSFNGEREIFSGTNISVIPDELCARLSWNAVLLLPDISSVPSNGTYVPPYGIYIPACGTENISAERYAPTVDSDTKAPDSLDAKTA